MKISRVHFVLSIIFYTVHCSVASTESHLQSLLTVASQATLAEDGKLNFTQLVVKYGQSVEQYDVVTEDGYVLTVFRIPGEKPPVLLFHGIAASSDTFIMKGNASLTITLANHGYDVWVGNNRGNLYGRRHVTLNPDTDKKFWDYSFHEIGLYDIAATIDFIRRKTDSESISVVGHSQGTSAFFALASSRPEYNKRVNLFIAFSPIAFLNDLSSPLPILAALGPAIFRALKQSGIEELLQKHKVASDLLTIACTKGAFSYELCGRGIFMTIAGIDPAALKPEDLSVVFGHYPCGVSRKCLEHYDQIVLNGRFAQYNYGAENIIKYGSSCPPEYDLTAVKSKVALFFGKEDKLVSEANAKRLNAVLPNVVHYEVMEPPHWGHLDFMVGKNMPKYLYPSLFNLLEKYSS